MDPSISMEAGHGGNSPAMDFNIDDFFSKDCYLPPPSPPHNPDSIESTPQEGGSLLFNSRTTFVQVASETDVLGISSMAIPDLDPSDPDHQAVEKLRKMSRAEDCPIENKNLSLHPSLIHEKTFASDIFDLLAKDTLPPSGAGSWKKHSLRREMGWAIRGCDEGRRIIAFKRTFVFHSNNNTKTNWIMNAYALVTKSGSIITTKYLCYVFQDNKYNPRPFHRSPLPMLNANETPQMDPARAIEIEKIRRKCHEICMAYKAKWDENCDPNAAGSSTGTASGKKRKIWDNFTEISASSGPEGNVLTLCICNVCDMAYKKTSGTGSLGRHRCSND